MARRSHPAPKQGVKLTAPAPEPVVAPGPDSPPTEPAAQPLPADTAPAPEPVVEPTTAPATTNPAPARRRAPASGANLGDWDGDGRPGGAHAAAVPSAPREKTLHELNLEARATDRAHAEASQAAEQKFKEVVEPMLAGVMRPRMRHRRVQKNLRPVAV